MVPMNPKIFKPFAYIYFAWFVWLTLKSTWISNYNVIKSFRCNDNTQISGKSITLLRYFGVKVIMDKFLMISVSAI